MSVDIIFDKENGRVTARMDKTLFIRLARGDAQAATDLRNEALLEDPSFIEEMILSIGTDAIVADYTDPVRKEVIESPLCRTMTEVAQKAGRSVGELIDALTLVYSAKKVNLEETLLAKAFYWADSPQGDKYWREWSELQIKFIHG